MIDSVDAFKDRIKEIDILLTYARNNQRTLDKYKLFNKTAVVLLCTHFEVFVESFIADHVDALQRCYKSDTIPQYMKDNYINDTIKSLKDLACPSKKAKPLRALFRLHDSKVLDMSAISDLEIDMKYSFGKHGQDDTAKLFRKFGFAAFVDSPAFKAPFRNINSAINIRNNIIHEGSAPNLSHNDVIMYKNDFLKFATELELHVLANQENYYGKVYYI